MRLSPYTNVNADRTNAVSKHGSGFYLLETGRVVNFSSYGEIPVFGRIQSSTSVNSNYCHLAKVGDSKLLAVGSSGIGVYSDKNFRMVKTKHGIDTIASYAADGYTQYIHNDGETVLTSTNYKIWKPLLSLPSQAGQVRDIVCLNDKTYLFGAAGGLYGTQYSFDIVDDTSPMSKDSALGIYNNLVAS